MRRAAILLLVAVAAGLPAMGQAPGAKDPCPAYVPYACKSFAERATIAHGFLHDFYASRDFDTAAVTGANGRNNLAIRSDVALKNASTAVLSTTMNVGDDQEMRWQVLALYIELFQALDNGRLFEGTWFAGRNEHERTCFIEDGLYDSHDPAAVAEAKASERRNEIVCAHVNDATGLKNTDRDVSVTFYRMIFGNSYFPSRVDRERQGHASGRHRGFRRSAKQCCWRASRPSGRATAERVGAARSLSGCAAADEVKNGAIRSGTGGWRRCRRLRRRCRRGCFLAWNAPPRARTGMGAAARAGLVEQGQPGPVPAPGAFGDELIGWIADALGPITFSKTEAEEDEIRSDVSGGDDVGEGVAGEADDGCGQASGGCRASEPGAGVSSPGDEVRMGRRRRGRRGPRRLVELMRNFTGRCAGPGAWVRRVTRISAEQARRGLRE